MAIEILKPPAAPLSATFTCMGCKAELRAGETDGHRSDDQREGLSIVIRCPCCMHENYVDQRHFK